MLPDADEYVRQKVGHHRTRKLDGNQESSRVGAQVAERRQLIAWRRESQEREHCKIHPESR